MSFERGYIQQVNRAAGKFDPSFRFVALEMSGDYLPGGPDSISEQLMGNRHLVVLAQL